MQDWKKEEKKEYPKQPEQFKAQLPSIMDSNPTDFNQKLVEAVMANGITGSVENAVINFLPAQPGTFASRLSVGVKGKIYVRPQFKDTLIKYLCLYKFVLTPEQNQEGYAVFKRP
jgi:hypothetical protein